MAPPLALTMGDPAGIGGEITLRAWQALRETGPAFVALDDPARLAALARRLGLAVPIRTLDSFTVNGFAEALPVWPIALPTPSIPGEPDAANASAVIASIEQAVRFTQEGAAGAVVTNPISKATLYRTGFPYPGHTEFLGALTGTDTAPVMMLAAPSLRVVPVTIHVALRRALELLRAEGIVHAARVTDAALRRDFGIARPRLAVAGLNPHAGEGGAMGDEEARIVEPALAVLRHAGIDARGPLPPDTMFTVRARAGYDAAICLYHDQALIPLKTLDMDNGVNVTLGLPIIRTSPDHGTAFDIAGRGLADPASLLAALRLAGQLAVNQGAA